LGNAPEVGMTSEPQYKTTMFDRHGPAASDDLKAWSYGFMVCGLTCGALLLQLGLHWWVFPIGIAAGAGAAGVGLLLARAAGDTYKHFMVDGSSTPYVEQHSYQQALVMKGDIDAALQSFESVIAEQPDAVAPRTKAAELYTREKSNHRRAAELFKDAQNIPSITVGEYVYVSNRLVDLYTGPLADPGRALVELRRLIERYPASPAAAHAREGLRVLKARHQTGS
jgi:hypothetical protein